jgi:raffinose/stachyose/melibiose transport system substrate-binding protein
MYMQRRWAAGIGALAISALALTGCSTADSGGGDPATTLTIGTDEEGRLTPTIDAFEAANPGVKVDLIASGSQGYEEFMRTRINAGTAPDILRVFPGSGGNTMTVGQLSKSELLTDLSDSSWASTLSPAQKSLFTDSSGKVVAVPLGATALAPVWNNNALAEIGASIPTSYQELLALCSTAAANGKVTLSMGQKDLFVTQLTPYAMVATSIYGPDPDFGQRQLDGQEKFVDSPWVDAFRQLQELSTAGCFNEGVNGTSNDEAMKMLGSGDALGQVTFADLSVQQEAAAEGTTFTMAAWPTDDGSEPYLAVADSYGFGISAKAKNPELAQKFIDFLAAPEGQNSFADTTGGVPSLPNDEFKPSSSTQEEVASYIQAERTGIWPDQLWPSPDVQQALFAGVQNLFNDADTPEGIAKAMDDAYQAALSK